MAIQNSENIANRAYRQIGSFTPGAAATELSIVIPAGTAGIRGRIEGGGAGGGGGARYSTTPIMGGIGGTHGGVVEFDFLLSQINCAPGDTLYVSVANAVAGGAGRTSTGLDGIAGTAGQVTIIRKTNSGGAIIARAAGGNAGLSVGQSVRGATAGVPCSWGDGVGSVATIGQGATNGTASRNASSGGGNGGSQTSSDANGANAGAPANELRTVAGATGGTWASGSPDGASGVSISVLSDASGFASGGGGGASVSVVTSVGGNGGNGGVNAGGGGGGSSFDTDGNSGAGGNGGPGRISIDLYVGSVMSADPNAWSFVQVAGLTDSTQIQALYALVAGLKANGTWSKYLAIYPFIGGTADTHKLNLKDPQDLDSSYRITWNASVTHSNTGISSASGGYGDTNLNPTVAGMSASSVALVTYQEVGTSDNTVSIGVEGSSPFVEWALAANTNSFFPAITSDGVYPADGGPDAGLFVATRNNATTVQGYNNSGTSSVDSAQGSTVVPNLDFYLLASNQGGSAVATSATPLRFAAIGSGLTSTEVGNDYTVIQAFQAALGRAL
jgi:hypothetical protein